MKILSRHRRHATRFFGFYLVTGLTSTAVAIYVLLNLPRLQPLYEQVPPVARLVYISAWVLLLGYRLWLRRSIDAKYRQRLQTDFSFLRRHNRREFILAMLGQGFIAIGGLYLTGWLLPIATFLDSTVTVFGPWLWNLIVSAVFWTITTAIGGIIGNYAYDRIKHKLPK